MKVLFKRQLLLFLMLSTVITSCQSEHEKLIVERNEAIDKLNELRRNLEENAVIGHESDLYEFLVQQKPLIDKIKRLNVQLKTDDKETFDISEHCMSYNELYEEIKKSSQSGYSGLIDTRLLVGVFEEVDNNSCLFKEN